MNIVAMRKCHLKQYTVSDYAQQDKLGSDNPALNMEILPRKEPLDPALMHLAGALIAWERASDVRRGTPRE